MTGTLCNPGQPKMMGLGESPGQSRSRTQPRLLPPRRLCTCSLIWLSFFGWKTPAIIPETLPVSRRKIITNLGTFLLFLRGRHCGFLAFHEMQNAAPLPAPMASTAQGGCWPLKPHGQGRPPTRVACSS